MKSFPPLPPLTPGDVAVIPFVRWEMECIHCGARLVREGDETGTVQALRHDCATGEWEIDPT